MEFPLYRNCLVRVTSLSASREAWVPRNTIGTLTLSNSESVHNTIFSITLNKPSAMATPTHPESLPSKNYLRVVALAPNLQRVSI
jgi:hypothetical protein